MTVPGPEAHPGAELERDVIDGLVWAGLLKKDEILFTDRSDVRHAYVVFDHQYHARRKAIFDWTSAVGLTPLGRFGRFEYDNSDQCVIKARELASELLGQAVRG